MQGFIKELKSTLQMQKSRDEGKLVELQQVALLGHTTASGTKKHKSGEKGRRMRTEQGRRETGRRDRREGGEYGQIRKTSTAINVHCSVSLLQAAVPLIPKLVHLEDRGGMNEIEERGKRCCYCRRNDEKLRTCVNCGCGYAKPVT